VSPTGSRVNPRTSETAEAPVEPSGIMSAGDLDHLYSMVLGCLECRGRLAASDDGGATWRWHDLPVEGPVALEVAAPRTLVMRSDPEGMNDVARMKWHASTDGGATWRKVTLRKVASVPAGWVAAYLGDGVFAADPATGDLAMLTSSPVKVRPLMEDGLPASAGIWVTGYATQGGREVSVIANSRDGGVNWRTHTFPEKVVCGFDHDWGSLAVATADGQTVYAVGKVGRQLHIYRSTDGGGSWQRTAARADAGDGLLEAAVLADGALVIRFNGREGGHRLLRSTDGGESVAPADLGPGARAHAVPGGNVEADFDGGGGLWLYTPGGGWRLVAPPKE
jgi:hypothetical protein